MVVPARARCNKYCGPVVFRASPEVNVSEARIARMGAPGGGSRSTSEAVEYGQDTIGLYCKDPLDRAPSYLI